MMEGIKPTLCMKIDCLARKESGDERHLLFSETAQKHTFCLHS